MPSRKQVIYCRLLYHGLLHLRAICGGGAWGTDKEVLALREEFRLGQEHANFLHRVHSSILQPEYVDNDLTFINWAFPVHIQRFGDQLDADTASLMLEFYKGVPDSLRSQLEWHPSPEFLRLAGSARRAQPSEGDAPPLVG
jgi:hypothetical protein